MTPTPYESMFEADYFAKGLAVCEAHILTDTIYCRFRDEEFEYPSRQVHAMQNTTGAFNTIKVAKLRALKKEE